jgi:hypothetical protein
MAYSLYQRPYLILRWDSGGSLHYFEVVEESYAGDTETLPRTGDYSVDDGRARTRQELYAFRSFVGTVRVKAEPTASALFGGEVVTEGSWQELMDAYNADDLFVKGFGETDLEDWWAGVMMGDGLTVPDCDPMLGLTSVQVKIQGIGQESIA